MVSTLVLGAALAAPAAPVPPGATPAPTSPAPWILYLKSDQSGNIRLITYKTQKVKVTRTIMENQNGKPVTKTVEQEITRMVPTSFQLDQQSAKFTTAAGTSLDADAILKQARDGIVVLVSADGKPVEKAWLRAVGAGTVVMAADGLANSQLPPASSMRLATAAPRLVLLGTGADGKVQVTCNPNPSAPVQSSRVVFVNNGAGVQQVVLANAGVASSRNQVAEKYPNKSLEDLNFEAYDLSGKLVPRESALERLRAGGLVLIAGDNRFPDENYVKPFQGDLLVLVSQELLNVPLSPGAVPAPVVQPALVRPALRLAPVLVPARPVQRAPAPANKAVPAKPADELKPVDEAKPKAEPAKPVRLLPARVAPAVPRLPARVLPVKPPIEPMPGESNEK